MFGKHLALSVPTVGTPLKLSLAFPLAANPESRATSGASSSTVRMRHFIALVI
jgi:hypothetical protein